MPIYVFKCPTCDKDFEALCKMGAASEPCPVCGTPGIKQLTTHSWARIKGYSEKNGYSVYDPARHES